MILKTIAEHTVDISLLNGGYCIDIGCRGFEFSKAMNDLGCKVFSYDLEPMTPPENVEFVRAAVTNKNGIAIFKKTNDPNATFLSEDGTETINSIALNDIYNFLRDKDIDCLKLDCESSEYFILSDVNFKPLPKMISVEFHRHSQPHMHDRYYDKCMQNLLQHYTAVQHNYYSAHGAGYNHWDSLFIKKNLL